MYEAVEGIRAGGQVRVLALGNPTVAGGPFYDAFTTNRASWRTFTINAFDTPNLEGLPLETLRLLPKGLSENDSAFEFQPRPYMVTRRWVYEKLWEWGEDSPLWQSRVLGSFPEQAEDSRISLKWLEAARPPTVLPNDEAKLYAGIDVDERRRRRDRVCSTYAVGQDRRDAILARQLTRTRDRILKDVQGSVG